MSAQNKQRPPFDQPAGLVTVCFVAAWVGSVLGNLCWQLLTRH